MALILDGRKARDFYTKKLLERISVLKNKPVLAIIQIGDIEESNIYIEQKKKFGQKIGVHVEHVRFPKDVRLEEVKGEIEKLNIEKKINGIILQLPAPDGFDSLSALNSVGPSKDVDGLTDTQSKFLSQAKKCFAPATAKGIVSLLEFYKIPVVHKKIAVLGRSRLVGGPVTQVLKNKGAKVTVCHSKTQNTKEITRNSDIVIVAIGKRHLVDSSYLTHGQIVVDVGINNKGMDIQVGTSKTEIAGDVDYKSVVPSASAITPVPGGVGPMTVLSLFENVVSSAESAIINK